MNKLKTLYDISWKVSEEEYRKDKAYSYSTLARFNREGFNNLYKLFDKIESPSLLFGSIVDTLLTGTQEEFDSKYVIADFPAITDSLIQISKKLFDSYHESYKTIDEIPDNILASVGAECGYYTSDKYATYRVKKIKEECSNYYNLLYLALNKTLISNADYVLALSCSDSLKNDSATSYYFKPNDPFDNKIERFYQLKFKGTYDNISLRCMADLLIVDREHKIILPCDLKTSSKPEWDFYKSFIDWNYWIQAQLYWYIIRQNLDNDEEFKDYTLANYRFIVINKNNLKPLVWEYRDTQSTVDLYYGNNDKYKCKNWREIVRELNFYLTSNPKYPLNIKEINDISDWLNSNISTQIIE